MPADFARLQCHKLPLNSHSKEPLKFSSLVYFHLITLPNDNSGHRGRHERERIV